jgi:nitrate/nitrite transport system permease protein
MLREASPSAASDAGALFTIAICSMWPTVLNTAVGVRAVPQDYLNVAPRAQTLPWKTLFKVLIPATLPTCSPASDSASASLAGHRRRRNAHRPPGVGGFLWQEYNASSTSTSSSASSPSASSASVLDRLMSLIESRFKTGRTSPNTSRWSNSATPHTSCPRNSPAA